MTTRIWIEAIRRPDGRKHYTTHRGLLLIARLGGPNGEILVQGVHNAVFEACRALMSRGIVGAFETWKPSLPYPCLRGDIEQTAGLTVYEPDDVKDSRPIHFRPWRPFDVEALTGVACQDAHCGGTGLAPAREEDRVGRRVAADTIASLRSDRDPMPEAAE
jgi:hypothetical protein